jgi:hypothetical protein
MGKFDHEYDATYLATQEVRFLPLSLSCCSSIPAMGNFNGGGSHKKSELIMRGCSDLPIHIHIHTPVRAGLNLLVVVSKILFWGLRPTLRAKHCICPSFDRREKH